MSGFAGSDISLPVEEPFGDLELSWVLHDGNDSLELIGVEFSGTTSQRAPSERSELARGDGNQSP
jgi:hypothetical protein